MSQLKETTWVWTIVQDPEGNEQFLGQHDELSNIRALFLNLLVVRTGHRPYSARDENSTVGDGAPRSRGGKS